MREKFCGIKIWFWHQIVSSWFNISTFSHIFHSFWKLNYSFNSKTSFSKSFFPFVLGQCSYQYMVLAKHFKTNLWVNASFRFLLWITYSVSSCKLATSFSTLQFSFFLLEMVHHYGIHVIFWYVQKISKKYPSLLSSL